jgi:hypothetical protein
MENCAYCLGERSPCTCGEDCDARFPHWCPKAEGYIESLRQTGFYSEAELDTLEAQGFK